MLFKCKWVLLLAVFVFIAGCPSSKLSRNGGIKTKPPTQMPPPQANPDQYGSGQYSYGQSGYGSQSDKYSKLGIPDTFGPNFIGYGFIEIEGKDNFEFKSSFPIKLGEVVVNLPRLDRGKYKLNIYFDSAPKPRFFNLNVKAMVTNPMAPYVSQFGYVEIKGSNKVDKKENFPVKRGIHNVSFAQVAPGKYDMEISYKIDDKIKNCDMRVKVKITDPIAPYLSDFGKVTVRGKEGFKTSKTFPVKFGTQMITIPELEEGRYDVEVSYGDYIATKCVILGCRCSDNWKQVFNRIAAAQMRSQQGIGQSSDGTDQYSLNSQWPYGSSPYSFNSDAGDYQPFDNQEYDYSYDYSNYYGYDSTSYGGYGSGLMIKGSGLQKPPCSYGTPCNTNVIFEMPKDAK